MKPKNRFTKAVNAVAAVHCALGIGKLREEVWVDFQGKVVRYNLAFINHLLYSGDNGRVLGYDCAHGYHHRHFMGCVEKIQFPGYERLSEQFFNEVSVLRKKGES